MKILALETSAAACSAALCQDGTLLAQSWQNSGLTHSRTLLPLVDSMLKNCGASLKEVEVIAVAAGPGSFTGLRIGLSAVKGMAHALGKSCVGVSTLEALAWNLSGMDAAVCPVLDARCSQVYTALFRSGGDFPERLAGDEAVSLSALEERLKKFGERVFLVGDGAEMCYNMFKDRVANLTLPSPALRFPRASSAALAAGRAYLRGDVLPPASLAPAYLRLPQAERERLAKLTKEGSSI